MSKPSFNRLSLVFIFSLLIILLSCSKNQKTIEISSGPHLFIDNYLIDDQQFLNRTINHPQKRPEPIVTGGRKGDQNFQPYMSVLRDPDTGKFRIWYNTPENKGQSHIGYMESDDGINWIRPHRVLKDPFRIKFGVTVLDRGKEYKDLQQRYLFAGYGDWTQPDIVDGYKFHDGGLVLATSADGLQWKAMEDSSLLKHTHDINSLHWDPILKHYVFFFSERIGSPRWEFYRRITHSSVSKDLYHWEKGWTIFEPETGAAIEQGETQFYSMSGMLVRGDLRIGLVKILRDDINATAGKSAKEMGDLTRKAAGVGYTVLAWSRDGRTWHRDHEPFMENNPIAGTWDHAHAWGDEQIIVDDETYIYYGGYAGGHKVKRFEQRHIGFAKIARDRYVSRDANINWGLLVSKPLKINANSMTLNANIEGEIMVRLTDLDGEELAGFGWFNLNGDNIAHPVEWAAGLQTISDKAVRLEFKMQYAQLFGFDLH